MIIPHTDNRLSWPGAISLEQTASFTKPWRIPIDQRPLLFSTLCVAAERPSGVRLAFRSTTRHLAGQTEAFELGRKIDLVIDGQLIATAELTTAGDFQFEDLPEGDKNIELWLPPDSPFALRHLEIDEAASLQPFVEKRPNWVTYGSSITQSGAAISPALIWPSIVARDRGLNLTSLGYGGQCHLDPLIAVLIRDRPADYISICAGINVHGQGSLNQRTFGSNLIGFVRLIREKHPATPLLLISPIFAVNRESNVNSAGWTLQDYREAVMKAAETLRLAGDAQIRYLDGRELFDASLQHLLPDGLHPNGEGYQLIGRNFLQRAAPLLFDAGQQPPGYFNIGGRSL